MFGMAGNADDRREDRPRPGSAAGRRGAHAAPPNRFESARIESDLEHAGGEADWMPADPRSVPTQFLPDHSRSIIAQNNSPDIGFRYSINAYRGCEHGCAYCYARPTHEYLALNAGIDFETKILVKERAPELLRAELNHPNWVCEPIAFSGVTDCYQPIEHKLRLTRGCLEVMLEARQPATIVTKNALVLRDLDLLAEMARLRLTAVFISVTTLDRDLARTMEPRTSAPTARLRAIRKLRAAGVPVGVMVAPVIPGLTDRGMANVLEAAAQAGAMTAGWTLLRLPLTVKPVFREWLARERPLQQSRVEAFIRATRDGALNQAEFGQRMRGEGPMAEQIGQMFRVFAARHGLDHRLPELDCTQFRPPRPIEGQMRMF
jgi:DNA repair photolyase